MKRMIVTIFSLGMALVVASARADMKEPDALVRDTAKEVLLLVKQDKDIKSGNQKKLLDLVEAKILPHFDFERMTRLTTSRNWRSATAEQRTALVTEFRTLLVRTYTAAFSRYQDQEVEVKPPKTHPGTDEVTVMSMIVKPGSPSIAVDYEMEKTSDGWKVFDMSVEGASLVVTYRSTFAEEIQKGGVDGLIKMLADKNRANAGKSLNKADAK